LSPPSEKSQKTVLKDGENVVVRGDPGANIALYPQAVGMHGEWLCGSIAQTSASHKNAKELSKSAQRKPGRWPGSTMIRDDIHQNGAYFPKEFTRALSRETFRDAVFL
jgi:hypothetical protein